MKQICKEYNTTYIKNMNQKDKDFVRGVVNYSINMDDDNCNKTLIILLYNYFNNISKLPIVDYITGPFTLSYHYIPSLNKKIYIFGEYHPFKNPCPDNYMNIYDYLEKLFLNTPVFIDFYLEYDRKDVDDEEKYIQEYEFSKKYFERYTLHSFIQKHKIINYLRYKFIKCIHHKKDTLCQSIRSHYIDMRPNHYRNHEYISELNEIIYFFTNINYENTIEKKVEFFNLVFSTEENRIMLKNVLTYLSGENLDNYILEEILKHPKIKKEIEKVNIFIRMKILNFFQFTKIVSKDNLKNIKIINILKIISANIENNRSDILYGFSNIFQKYLYVISTINALLIQIDILYVDIYTITRLFIQFDTSSKNKKHNSPSHQNNIIIYTGNYHSENYRNFFISLNDIAYNTFYTTRNDTKSENNCLDMRNVPQPFFQ